MTPAERFLESMDMNNEARKRLFEGVAWALALEAGMGILILLGVWVLWAVMR